MDLQRLKIDRDKPAGAGSTKGRGAQRRFARFGGLGRWVFLAAIIALAWLFKNPLLRTVDLLRLPAVDVTRVIEQSPAAAGSTAGAAANGYVIARTRAALSADTPGRIVELNVEEGQAVKEGFVVARLYAAEYEAQLRRAEADLQIGAAELDRFKAELSASRSELERLAAARDAAQARIEEAVAERQLAVIRFERTEKLVADNMESEQKLDEDRSALDAANAKVLSARADAIAAVAAIAQGQARVAVAEAAVAEAEARLGFYAAARDLADATLDKTRVRAPFDGIVVLKDAEVGEVVSPNSQAGSNARGSVVTMVDFRSLEVQAEVPETSLAAVRLNEPARVFLDAFPRQPYSGRVDRIWPTANRQKATIEVRVTFDQPDDRLRPEMGARIVFLEKEDANVGNDVIEPVLLIPEDAVLRVAGDTFVFVVERDVVRQQAVRLEPWRSGRLVVLDGLTAEETIVRNPPSSLEDGDRVRIKRP